MQPSKYQDQIYDWIKNGSGNAMVEAVAGSGKTTTIVNCLDLINPFDTVLFLAFNKAIADELKKRAPLNTTAMTFNSFGYKIIRTARGHCKTSSRKVANILRYQVLENDWQSFIKMQKSVCQIISLLKAHGRTELDYADLADKFSIDTPKHKDFNSALHATWRLDQDNPKVIDFDDQIYLPVVKDMEFPAYNWVFVDEAQDLNTIQIEALKRIKGTPRIICVGDRAQSIYGFRGADSEAIPTIINELDCTTMPLSVCYRCSRAVVQEAKKLVSVIEPFEGQIEGSVLDGELAPSPGDFVLCRTTAPLVQNCLKLIKQGVKCTVKGKAIGEDLKELHKKIQLPYAEGIEKFRADYDRKYPKRNNSDMHDKLDTLLAIYAYDEDVALAIDMIFSDELSAITFCTIHRAKGLEADRVFILHPELLPHPNSKQEWERVQEKNLHYVAITRAKKELVYVRS